MKAVAFLLDQFHLKLGTPTQQPSDSVPSGQIISQDPTSGSRAHHGDTVNVVVSSGPNSVTVPDVTWTLGPGNRPTWVKMDSGMRSSEKTVRTLFMNGS